MGGGGGGTEACAGFFFFLQQNYSFLSPQEAHTQKKKDRKKAELTMNFLNMPTETTTGATGTWWTLAYLGSTVWDLIVTKTIKYPCSL